MMHLILVSLMVAQFLMPNGLIWIDRHWKSPLGVVLAVSKNRILITMPLLCCLTVA